ncbi:ACC oxidase [Hordeum vulgare]|nr:ACC oxidase [Hordeum vulgare]
MRLAPGGRHGLGGTFLPPRRQPVAPPTRRPSRRPCGSTAPTLKKLAERVMEAMGREPRPGQGPHEGRLHRRRPPRTIFRHQGQPIPAVPRAQTSSSPDSARTPTPGGVILLFQDDKVGGLEVLKDGQWLDVQAAPRRHRGQHRRPGGGAQQRPLPQRLAPASCPCATATAAPSRSFYNPAFEGGHLAGGGRGGAAAYPDYVFGDYMDVYNKQKFDAKEPRFEAVKAPKSSLIKLIIKEIKEIITY